MTALQASKSVAANVREWLVVIPDYANVVIYTVHRINAELVQGEKRTDSIHSLPDELPYDPNIHLISLRCIKKATFPGRVNMSTHL